eukprot:56771_1
MCKAIIILIATLVAVANCNRIIDLLIKAANPFGEDLCAGCDEVLCNQQADCGYVQVKNGGGYVAKICVNGKFNATGQNFCCTSGGFDLGQTAQIKLPCDGLELTLTA